MNTQVNSITTVVIGPGMVALFYLISHLIIFTFAKTMNRRCGELFCKTCTKNVRRLNQNAQFDVEFGLLSGDDSDINEKWLLEKELRRIDYSNK